MLTIAITIGAGISLTIAGILANSLRHRNTELEQTVENHKRTIEEYNSLLDQSKATENTIQNMAKEVRLVKAMASELNSRNKALIAKLKTAHIRKGKKLLPLGTDVDGKKF